MKQNKTNEIKWSFYLLDNNGKENLINYLYIRGNNSQISRLSQMISISHGGENFIFDKDQNKVVFKVVTKNTNAFFTKLDLMKNTFEVLQGMSLR